MLLDHKFGLTPADLAEITELWVVEGLSLCPGDFFDNSLILSGIYFCFLVQLKFQRKKTAAHPPWRDSVFMCVFSALDSAGLLAEGTLLTPSVAKSFISCSWRFLNKCWAVESWVIGNALGLPIVFP